MPTVYPDKVRYIALTCELFPGGRLQNETSVSQFGLPGWTIWPFALGLYTLGTLRIEPHLC